MAVKKRSRLKSRKARSKSSKRSKNKAQLTAKDIMNPWVLTVRDDMTVQELGTFLTENEISGAPVVDAMGKLVGVVSLTDIARNAAGSAALATAQANPDYYVRGWEDKMNSDEMGPLHIEKEGGLVREIMTPTLYTVREETPVAQVAKTMLSGHIHRLLVTRRGQVAGIVTTTDMLKLLLRQS